MYQGQHHQGLPEGGSVIVQGNNIYGAWVSLLGELLKGHEVHPRGMTCKEIIGLQLRLDSLNKNLICDPQRKLNYRFAVAEWLWMMCGLDSLEVLTRYNSQMTQFSDDGKILAGAYGPRLLPQWPYLMKTMTADMETRQAVMGIWTPSPSPSKDIPCTLTFQFLCRPDERGLWKLHMIVNMRSSDAWLGIPYDVFSFTQLAQVFCAALRHVTRRNIVPGELIMNLGSSHLYERDWETARSIVNAPTGRTVASPPLPTGTNTPQDLEKILVEGGEAEPKFDDPWRSYAKVLMSKTSAEALELLIGLEPR
jgi:thymidylate synthase